MLIKRLERKQAGRSSARAQEQNANWRRELRAMEATDQFSP